jgi:hypothetical protein
MRQLKVWSRLWVAVYKILGWRFVIKGLVRTDPIVGSFPLPQGSVETGEIQIPIVDFIELLDVGPMGSLYMAVQFRTSGWQDKETDLVGFAGLFKVCLKLRASIYLDGSYREGHTADEGIQKAGGCVGRGLPVRFQHIPTGDHIPGGEVLQDYARQRSYI